MISMLNFINDIANSNFAFTVLIVILVVVGIAMAYLIYSQNKEIKMEAERRRQEVDSTKNTIKNFNGSEEKKDDIPEIIPEDSKKGEVVEEVSVEENEDTIEESLQEFRELQEEVNNGNFDGVPYNKVIPEYDNIVSDDGQESDVKEEYEGSIEDLQSITKELEVLPREKTIELTPYEEEQESKAIISYDELVNNRRNDEINYSDTNKAEEIEIKQVDLEKTGNIEIVRDPQEMPVIKEIVPEVEPVIEEIIPQDSNVVEDDYSKLDEYVKDDASSKKATYYHEEEYLQGLKELRKDLLN